MRRKKPRTIALAVDDPGLQEIADWQDWFLGAQLATIAANPDMHDGERETSIRAAKSLTIAVADKMREDYLIHLHQKR